MIQPGLIPLQPNLDFMDTFEPFQGEDLGQRKSTATCISLYPGQRGCCFPVIEATVRMDQGEDLEFFQNFFFFASSCKAWKVFLGCRSVSSSTSQSLWFGFDCKQFSH